MNTDIINKWLNGNKKEAIEILMLEFNPHQEILNIISCGEKTIALEILTFKLYLEVTK